MWKPNYKLGYAFGALYLAAFAAGAALYPLSWKLWLLAFGLHALIFSFGVSFGLHKSAAHGMARFDHPVVRVAALIGTFANVGSPVDFIITHRVHHRFADSPNDPQHSARLGWRLLFGFKTADGDPVTDLFEARAALKSKYFLWIHRYYYLILLAPPALAFALGGVPGLLFGALIPSGLSFFALGFLNYLGHSREGARNVTWLFPLLLGENWHGNHHGNPSLVNYRRKFHEIDVSALYFIFVRRTR